MNRRAHPRVGENSDRIPEPQTVAARAHELWVSCGEPVVPDDAIWREAERELLTERRQQESATPFPRRSR